MRPLRKSNVYADALRAFAKTVASAQKFSTSPAKASLTILRAVTAPRPRTRYLIGADAKLSAFLKRNLPDRWMDAIIFWMFGLPRRLQHQEDSNAPTGIEAVSGHPTHK